MTNSIMSVRLTATFGLIFFLNFVAVAQDFCDTSDKDCDCTIDCCCPGYVPNRNDYSQNPFFITIVVEGDISNESFRHLNEAVKDIKINFYTDESCKAKIAYFASNLSSPNVKKALDDNRFHVIPYPNDGKEIASNASREDWLQVINKSSTMYVGLNKERDKDTTWTVFRSPLYSWNNNLFDALYNVRTQQLFHDFESIEKVSLPLTIDFSYKTKRPLYPFLLDHLTVLCSNDSSILKGATPICPGRYKDQWILPNNAVFTKFGSDCYTLAECQNKIREENSSETLLELLYNNFDHRSQNQTHQPFNGFWQSRQPMTIVVSEDYFKSNENATKTLEKFFSYVSKTEIAYFVHPSMVIKWMKEQHTIKDLRRLIYGRVMLELDCNTSGGVTETWAIFACLIAMCIFYLLSPAKFCVCLCAKFCACLCSKQSKESSPDAPSENFSLEDISTFTETEEKTKKQQKLLEKVSQEDPCEDEDSKLQTSVKYLELSPHKSLRSIHLCFGMMLIPAIALIWKVNFGKKMRLWRAAAVTFTVGQISLLTAPWLVSVSRIWYQYEKDKARSSDIKNNQNESAAISLFAVTLASNVCLFALNSYFYLKRIAPFFGELDKIIENDKEQVLKELKKKICFPILVIGFIAIIFAGLLASTGPMLFTDDLRVGWAFGEYSNNSAGVHYGVMVFIMITASITYNFFVLIHLSSSTLIFYQNKKEKDNKALQKIRQLHEKYLFPGSLKVFITLLFVNLLYCGVFTFYVIFDVNYLDFQRKCQVISLYILLYLENISLFIAFQNYQDFYKIRPLQSNNDEKEDNKELKLSNPRENKALQLIGAQAPFVVVHTASLVALVAVPSMEKLLH